MSKQLTGKAALVTGGSRGIGAAIARALADDGADVAISYVSSPDKAEALVSELKAKGVRAAAFKADQADAAQVESMVHAAAKHFGRLDILVNNAGVYAGGPVDAAYDAAGVERQFKVNVIGVAAATRAAVQHIGKGGRIINIGSILADRTNSGGLADYAATKAAVATYARNWAKDLGPKGITVNTIQPGPIDTDMNPADGPGAEAQRSTVPLGHYGQPEELAAAVAFLAGPGASYISGATLNVDGGFGA